MKIVRFIQDQREPAYGVLESKSAIRPIHGDIFGEWRSGDERIGLSSVRLLAPVQPPNVLAIGLNYRAHARESGQVIPKAPIVFIKANTTVIGPEERILLPAMAPNEVDYEGELVVVMGRRCSSVADDRALEYVLGYTCGNDVSARDCQLRIDRQWARGKSFDTFAPLGPCIETELNPDACTIHTRLNGRIMQNSTTKDLIFNVRQLISYLSRCMTLLPGTVIMTGTPAGVGFTRKPPIFLKVGDSVEVEIEGIGSLRNLVAGAS